MPAGERFHKNFINAFLSYTNNSESSERIRLWAAISTVAAALERRCHLTWGHTTIYPNLYTIIVAPSGARKGEPLVISRKLLQDVGVTLVAERITDEALLNFIAKSQDTFQDTRGKLRFQCAVAIVGEELSVLLRNKDVGFMADLTALYDCRDHWTYQTKGSGTDELTGGCLNILASTAPDWLPSIFPVEAVGGGFTSRCFFVVEEKRGKIVPDPNSNMPDESERIALQHDLELIMGITGEYTLTPEAMEFYTEWYIKDAEQYETGQYHITDYKLSNYISRRATHIKKLGMIISAAQNSSCLITRDNLEVALSYLLDIEALMPEAFKTLGHSNDATLLDAALSILKARKEISRAKLMRLLKRDMDFGAFASLELTLLEMQYIERSKAGILKYKGGD